MVTLSGYVKQVSVIYMYRNCIYRVIGKTLINLQDRITNINNYFCSMTFHKVVYFLFDMASRC